MAAARARLASAGDLRQVEPGKGQIKAADYVMVPDLIAQNSNAGGNALGGLIGGLIGGRAGALASGLNLEEQDRRRGADR
jgi:hypothetical protein